MVCPSQPLTLVTAIPLKRNPKIGKMKEFDKMALLGQVKKEPEYRFRKLGGKAPLIPPQSEKFQDAPSLYSPDFF